MTNGRGGLVFKNATFHVNSVHARPFCWKDWKEDAWTWSLCRKSIAQTSDSRMDRAQKSAAKRRCADNNPITVWRFCHAPFFGDCSPGCVLLPGQKSVSADCQQ